MSQGTLNDDITLLNQTIETKNSQMLQTGQTIID